MIKIMIRSLIYLPIVFFKLMVSIATLYIIGVFGKADSWLLTLIGIGSIFWIADTLVKIIYSGRKDDGLF